MNKRLAVGLALAGVAAIAGLGYAAGVANTSGAAPGIAAFAAETEPAMSMDPAVPAQAMFSDMQQREVEAIIRNYLMANPEIIRDAITELQRKEDEAARLAQTQVIADNAALLFDSPREVVLGNPDGDVTLVEFFDYNCGYCRRAQADMQQLIAEDANLRVVLKEFPILSEESVQAAQVASAVLLTAPEKYGAFHDAMLMEPGQADGNVALSVAEDLGIDPEALKAMVDTDEVKAVISEAHTLAQQLQLTGTPSYVTERRVIVGAVGYEALKQEIAYVRACAADAANC
jgi:protein-disulfide isomerase